MTVFNAQESRVDKAAENTPPATATVQRKPARKTAAKEKPAAGRKAGAKEASDTPRRRKGTTARQNTPPEPISTAK